MPKKIDIILINALTFLVCFIVIMAAALTYMTIDVISTIFSKVF